MTPLELTPAMAAAYRALDADITSCLAMRRRLRPTRHRAGIKAARTRRQNQMPRSGGSEKSPMGHFIPEGGLAGEGSLFPPRIAPAELGSAETLTMEGKY